MALGGVVGNETHRLYGKLRDRYKERIGGVLLFGMRCGAQLLNLHSRHLCDISYTNLSTDMVQASHQLQLLLRILDELY